MAPFPSFSALRSFALAATLALVGMPSARAGDPPFHLGPPAATANPEAAAASLATAVEAFKARKPAVALEHAEAAWRAGGSVDALELVAISALQAGKTPLAHQAYAHLATLEAAPPTVRARAEKQRAALEKQARGVLVEVEPAGALVTLDDVRLGAAPLQAAVYLFPGPHRLSVTAPGHQAGELRFQVGKTGAAGARLTLAPLEDAPVPASAAPPPPAAPPTAAASPAPAPPSSAPPPVAAVPAANVAASRLTGARVRATLLAPSALSAWLGRRVRVRTADGLREGVLQAIAETSIYVGEADDARRTSYARIVSIEPLAAAQTAPPGDTSTGDAALAGHFVEVVRSAGVVAKGYFAGRAGGCVHLVDDRGARCVRRTKSTVVNAIPADAAQANESTRRRADARDARRAAATGGTP